MNRAGLVLLLLLGSCTRSPGPTVPKVPPVEKGVPAQDLEVPLALIEVDGPGFREAVRGLLDRDDVRYVVANAWATWCGPCVEEFPYVQKVVREFRDQGVALAFVSTDFDSEKPSAIAFLKKQGADLPSYIKVGKDQPFIEAFHPEWSGSLPATAVYGPDGTPVRFHAGQIEESELRSMLAGLTQAENEGP